MLYGRPPKHRHRSEYSDSDHQSLVPPAVGHHLDRRAGQIKPISDVFYLHYKKIAGILLVVLLFTGGVNLHYVNQVMTSQTQLGIQHNAKYLTVFFIKLGLVLCLMTLFLYTVIFKSDDEAEDDEDYEVIPYQRAALWMGFFIVLCAAAMKHLHL
jgi:hypothetical protein